MHPNNRFQEDYDFVSLTKLESALQPYLKKNKLGKVSLDYGNSEAVKLLNKTLLRQQYGIEFWDIPTGYLCPPIPSRLDYLLYVADLLGQQNTPRFTRLLDIGTGANCIYPILAVKEFGWQAVGTEIDPKALRVAQAIVTANRALKGKISIRQQVDPNAIFAGVTAREEYFDVCVCNPPFYQSAQEATANWERKKRGLKQPSTKRNFGGQDTELWTKGGEKAFALRMIKESEQRPK
ncbi:MAG: RlmF-related methyltransferase, partial [Bacteroidota bacterium]